MRNIFGGSFGIGRQRRIAATSDPQKRRRAATPEPTALLQSAMQKIRRLHEEQRKDEEFVTMLRQRDDELLRVQQSI